MSKPTRNIGFNGAQLRRARRDKRLSQTELAERLGVHRSTIVRWEVGAGDPSPEQLEDIAVALSTPKAWFIEEAAEAIPPDDPLWLMDPVLKTYPLEQLQQNTSAAMLALGKSGLEIKRAVRWPRERVDELMAGKKPTPREIQRLRDVYGADFDPTPDGVQRPRSRKRKASGVAQTIPLGLPVGAPTAYLSGDEKLDVMMQRLARLEHLMLGMREEMAALKEELRLPQSRPSTAPRKSS